MCKEEYFFLLLNVTLLVRKKLFNDTKDISQLQSYYHIVNKMQQNVFILYSLRMLHGQKHEDLPSEWASNDNHC